MEPQIRFCTSADGTRIAYAVYGSGPPLLYRGNFWLSINARFTLPESRAFFDALAERTMLVTYDRRGTGASARDVDDLSPEAQDGDIAVVADAAGLRRFTLFAESPLHAPPHERIERLILWHPFASVDVREVARSGRKNWSYARRLFLGMVLPDGPSPLQRAVSVAMKETVSAEMAALTWEEYAKVNPEAVWPAVTAPALVLARERLSATTQGNMGVAGLLPNGEFRFVSGIAGLPFPEHEVVVEAVLEFMGLSAPTSAKQPTGTAIILFADIVDSTALTERLGDAAFREKARELDEALRRTIASNGGTAIDGKLLGDGVLATFGAAREAIACAAGMHDAGSRAALPLHVGIHAGDVIREKDNVYGGAVNIASRVAGEAAAGETLVSGTVRDLARTSAGVTFEDRGERELKGVGEPVRIYEVREAG